MQVYAIGTAGILVFGESLKRLVSVNWSLHAALIQSLGARGDREWDRLAWEGSNFMFALSGILMPLCALIAGYLIVSGRGRVRIASVPIFVIVMFFLVTDGSRTPVAIVSGSVWILAMWRWRSFLFRAIATGIIGLITAATFSLMIDFRGYGYITNIDQSTKFEFNYHQDDNYYRSLQAFNVADQSSYRWDAAEFFSTIAVNPIPRALWPDKPIIASGFFGDFKLAWTTIFFFGESVAMFGINTGLVAATLFGILLYNILYRAVDLLSKPLGMVAYLLVALCVYMCMRSMMCITQFMYLPIAGVTMVIILKRIARSRRRLAVQQGLSIP